MSLSSADSHGGTDREVVAAHWASVSLPEDQSAALPRSWFQAACWASSGAQPAPPWLSGTHAASGLGAFHRASVSAGVHEAAEAADGWADGGAWSPWRVLSYP